VKSDLDPAERNPFEVELAGRFGLVPNFFRSSAAAPELIQELWGFAKAAYLDNPMPSIFKERLFVWLSRFCPAHYCVVRHVGFLLGGNHGHAAGDPTAVPQTVEEVVELLRQPSPWQRDMAAVYALLEGSTLRESWPAPRSELEDAIFASAALLFAEPARSDRARRALIHAVGARRFEFLSGCLAFIRTAHYWTMLHPEIETEDDMRFLLRGHEELARLLLEDVEADRCEMGERLFEELTHLRDLNERQELEQAKRALEEKDRQKDAFIAVLAHELRNPLGAIRSATDAMGMIELQDPRALRLLERLDRQTTSMARMLEDLMDASRIALGKVSMQLERVPLLELMKHVLDEQQVHVRQAGLRIVERFPNQPCDVTADRVRLRQILDNLLSNAIKFTPAGGTIVIAVAEDGDHAVVTVHDSGVGFDQQFADRLFEPFMQEEQGRDRAAGGLGLGLAIASRLAAQQGGSLSAASDGLDKGARFTLRLPMSDLSAAPSSPDARAPQRRRQTVLLVEDNKDMADSLADLLGLTGFEVSVSHDGPAAIEAALELVPDLILCDLGLPGAVDGFAVARACRAVAALRSVRLVALSGYSSPHDHTAAREAGFECLLTKPITRDALNAMAHGSRA
jgi:signal transduction histidine kinase